MVTGIVSSYGQGCSGVYGASATGAADDMAVTIPATGGNAPKGYFGVNWYPTPDSTINPGSLSDPNYFSSERYTLSRVQVGSDWKMKVVATNADSTFATFGIGFPQSSPRPGTSLYGLDLSGNATMSIDVDNSAQATAGPGGAAIPLYFTANLTDANGVRVEYMADTNYSGMQNRFFNLYEKT